MAIKKLSIEEFLAKAKEHPVIDVRSPGEYLHAHIPGAHSLPLFTNEERKLVGTAYKQQGREQAIKIGLDFFGGKMRGMVEQVEEIVGRGKVAVGSRQSAVSSRQSAVSSRQSAVSSRQSAVAKSELISPDSELRTLNSELTTSKCVLIHCWRGGMRSAGVAWLLDLYGFEVYTLIGGYKAWRNWVLEQFEKDYNMKILGGYTGSGKTAVIHQLKKSGEQTIDLEGLANHKGSAFGGIGMPPQPSTEMFENLLAVELSNLNSQSFWLEDESQRIGILNIPHSLWKGMRSKPLFFMDVPFHERLQYIVKEYGICDKERLLLSIERIQKRLGPLETKNAITHLNRDEIELCFGILLLYYDKQYKKGLYNRENLESLLNKIPCLSVDSITNTENLLLCSTVNS